MLTRLAIKPESKEHWLSLRVNDITSTEASALFNLSPYASAFELWHNKKEANVIRIDENERMAWGNALEEAIVKEAARVNNWQGLKPLDEYMRIEALNLGSTFDFEAIIDDKRTLLEVKNVDGLVFRDKWNKDSDDNVEAPYHIEMQVQHQLLVSGLEQAYIVVLVAGNKLLTLKREANKEIQDAIVTGAKNFWNTIENNIPPKPNFETDSEFITKMFDTAAPGTVMNNANHIEDLALKYSEISAEIKNLTVSKDAAKAEMLTLIGDYEKVKGDRFSISAGEVASAAVSYERKAYRGFRVYIKKEKK